MNKLSRFLDLLKSPFKILSQNGKLMAITSTIYLIIYSLSFILYTKSTNPIIFDSIIKIMTLMSTPPGTPEYTKLMVAIREDIGIFLAILLAYFVFYFFVVLFAQTTVIIISSCYYNDTTISSFKDLKFKVSKTWTRPFVTSFYIQLLASGYTSFFFLPLLVPILVLFDHRIILIAFLIIFYLVFITFYFYLSVVWSLAVVVSIVEDTYGLLALGKARELVKNNRLNGFLLNILFALLMLIITIVGSKLSPAMPIVVGVVQFFLIGVISLFLFMTYSAFYYQCKNGLMESRGLEYNKIPSALVLDENLP
ncbi:uncharacterized protein [Rutidosis leptorrhynchoides]|uniref:uncharacterized protein n=1 Tax=Rutidosis leptorrhynchoides TaxID=125765 RepID=UPI003A98E5DF